MDRLDREGREVLTGYREGDRMPAAHKDAAWARLQRAIAAGERPASAEDDPEDMSAGSVVISLADRRRELRRQAVAWGIALAVAAGVVLTLSWMQALVGRRAGDDAGSQAIHGANGPALEPVQKASRTAAPAAAATAGAAQEPPDMPAGTGPAAPPVQRPRAEPRTDAGDDAADLDAELALLRRARAALAGGRADEALAVLAEHERAFPSGHLDEERALLRVQALCETGAGAQARAEAERFAQARPTSPHARKIVRVCVEAAAGD